MIIQIRADATSEQIAALQRQLECRGVQVDISLGEQAIIMGLVGDVAGIDLGGLQAEPIVEQVWRISEPYKLANRKMHAADTHIEVGGQIIGDGSFCVIAGPCSVESAEQINTLAKQVKAGGANFLRGGAFKPRTSPYSFQGLGAEGLQYLQQAGRDSGLPIVTEIMDLSQIELFAEVDIIQVGARNMQNFSLLKELAGCGKPILLKRGMANTITELLMSAEYLMAHGNDKIILCERGIRTFENYTRNTLDISAVPVLKRLSHLPVFVDPSHASGISWLVEPLTYAACAAGADGVMLEVHNQPTCALSDGAQAIKPANLARIVRRLTAVHQALNEEI